MPVKEVVGVNIAPSNALLILAIVALASVRYRLRYSNIPVRLRGVGMAMLLTGLLSMAFMAFSGIDL